MHSIDKHFPNYIDRCYMDPCYLEPGNIEPLLPWRCQANCRTSARIQTTSPAVSFLTGLTRSSRLMPSQRVKGAMTSTDE